MRTYKLSKYGLDRLNGEIFNLEDGQSICITCEVQPDGTRLLHAEAKIYTKRSSGYKKPLRKPAKQKPWYSRYW